jgi:hypothetical protein
MMLMNYESIDREAVEVTVGALVKDADDLEDFRSGALDRILARV